MKEDLAGGRLPSGYFGVNAAWSHIMILALNLNSAMKRLVLEETWVGKRMKAIRFWLIKLPGRVLKRARMLRVRLVGGHHEGGIHGPRRHQRIRRKMWWWVMANEGR